MNLHLLPAQIFAVLLTSSVVFAAQLKDCDPGKVLDCARECYPSCVEKKSCPKIAFCSRKECQCPDGKVASGRGQCIDPSLCEVQVRKKRQPNKDPLAIVSPVVRDALCIIRNNCPTTTTAKPPAACGANQRRYVCGTACEPTCAIPNPRVVPHA
ncbi:hypothetical protein Y032_0002g1090 [Ancylostoma ceylanicum]|uniref:TIL domain-containing protein n=1 Tax=Ancylostoma ceylanicum TaxID=53326 RepID=A0A016W0F8_9BILA|nr:hypothetical protein Y032_0002g1090 [Ancylostoma ceylanicum]